MNELAVVDKGADWRRLKVLVLDSVSSPITKRVYNLGLDEFFARYGQEPRPGFKKATLAAWRVALEARGLWAVSINGRIAAERKLAVEAADNGLLAPELADGITLVTGVASEGVRLGNWLTARQAQVTRRTPPPTRAAGLGHPRHAPGLRPQTLGGGGAYLQAHPAAGWPLVHRGSSRETWPGAHGADADLGKSRDRCVGHNRRDYRWPGFPLGQPWRRNPEHRI